MGQSNSVSYVGNIKNKRKIRNRNLSIFASILIIVSIVAGLYWLFLLKGYESTEDAYVSGNQVMVSTQVNGNVLQINADDMDLVRAGDLLLQLDDADYQLSFLQAQNNLATVVRQLSQLSYTVKQLQATVEANRIALSRAKGDLVRREQLAKTNSIDKETLQHAREAVTSAQANLSMAENQLSANQSLLLKTDLRQQPEVQKAISALKQAWLNLQRTKVLSPIDGYVARRSVQVGQRVAAGSALMAVISTDQMWVDANFKETQLKNMRIGQPVKLHFDLYGDDVTFDGTVAGIEMGTGSAFSLLPAQNATGNWIKVVQRVPVRIKLDPKQLKDHPLRLGLSAHVKVDVRDTDGAVLTQQPREQALYQTSVLGYDETVLNQLIEQILQHNQH